MMTPDEERIWLLKERDKLIETIRDLRNEISRLKQILAKDCPKI